VAEVWSIEIDEELCVGCGFCVDTCPEVFGWAGFKKAMVVNPEGCKICDCKEIAESCPEKAIKLELS